MPFYELIYTSVSSSEQTEDDVRQILSSSEQNNSTNSITGLLMFDGYRYIQILEGDVENVETIYDSILKDSRHKEIELLHKGSITNRSFENWRMAYELMPQGMLNGLAEKMAVFSMELDGAPLGKGESFGARLDVMFMTALAAE